MKGFERAWQERITLAVSLIFALYSLVSSSFALAKEFPGDFRHGFNLQQEPLSAFLRRFISGNGYQVIISDRVKKLDRKQYR